MQGSRQQVGHPTPCLRLPTSKQLRFRTAGSIPLAAMLAPVPRGRDAALPLAWRCAKQTVATSWSNCVRVRHQAAIKERARRASRINVPASATHLECAPRTAPDGGSNPRATETHQHASRPQAPAASANHLTGSVAAGWFRNAARTARGSSSAPAAEIRLSAQLRLPPAPNVNPRRANVSAPPHPAFAIHRAAG